MATVKVSGLLRGCGTGMATETAWGLSLGCGTSMSTEMAWGPSWGCGSSIATETALGVSSGYGTAMVTVMALGLMASRYGPALEQTSVVQGYGRPGSMSPGRPQAAGSRLRSGRRQRPRPTRLREAPSCDACG